VALSKTLALNLESLDREQNGLTQLHGLIPYASLKRLILDDKTARFSMTAKIVIDTTTVIGLQAHASTKPVTDILPSQTEVDEPAIQQTGIVRETRLP
jgi:hypothetical protein